MGGRAGRSPPALAIGRERQSWASLGRAASVEHRSVLSRVVRLGGTAEIVPHVTVVNSVSGLRLTRVTTSRHALLLCHTHSYFEGSLVPTAQRARSCRHVSTAPPASTTRRAKSTSLVATTVRRLLRSSSVTVTNRAPLHSSSASALACALSSGESGRRQERAAEARARARRKTRGCEDGRAAGRVERV